MNWIAVVAIEMMCVGLSYGGFRWYGYRVARRTDAAGWLRRGLSVGSAVVATLTAVLLDGTGLRQWAGATFPGAVGIVVGYTLLALGAYLAILAGYRATVPIDAAVRETTVDVDATTRQFAWFAATVVGGVDVVAVALAAGSWWTPAIAVVGAGVVFFVLAGDSVARLSTTRSPSAPERDRIRTALDRYVTTTGRPVSVRSLMVLDTDDSRWSGAFVRGPWRQSLFVASHLLESHTEDGVAAVLTVAVGRANRHYFAWKVATVTVLVGGVVSAVAVRSTVPAVSVLLVTITVGSYLVGCWWTRRCVFAADADALAVTDRRTLVETHRRVAADADTTLDAGRGLRNFLRGRASRARRLDELASSGGPP